MTNKRLKPDLVWMSNVQAEEVKWLWAGRIPLGRITLIVGRPGVGKSFLTAELAARVSRGEPWPDGSPCPLGHSLDAGWAALPRTRHGADVRADTGLSGGPADAR